MRRGYVIGAPCMVAQWQGGPDGGWADATKDRRSVEAVEGRLLLGVGAWYFVIRRTSGQAIA